MPVNSGTVVPIIIAHSDLNLISPASLGLWSRVRATEHLPVWYANAIWAQRHLSDIQNITAFGTGWPMVLIVSINTKVLAFGSFEPAATIVRVAARFPTTRCRIVALDSDIWWWSVLRRIRQDGWFRIQDLELVVAAVSMAHG